MVPLSVPSSESKPWEPSCILLSLISFTHSPHFAGSVFLIMVIAVSPSLFTCYCLCRPLSSLTQDNDVLSHQLYLPPALLQDIQALFCYKNDLPRMQVWLCCLHFPTYHHSVTLHCLPDKVTSLAWCVRPYAFRSLPFQLHFSLSSVNKELLKTAPPTEKILAILCI